MQQNDTRIAIICLFVSLTVFWLFEAILRLSSGNSTAFSVVWLSSDYLTIFRLFDCLFGCTTVFSVIWLSFDFYLTIFRLFDSLFGYFPFFRPFHCVFDFFSVIWVFRLLTAFLLFDDLLTIWLCLFGYLTVYWPIDCLFGYLTVFGLFDSRFGYLTSTRMTIKLH